jgi:uncharacterized protein
MTTSASTTTDGAAETRDTRVHVAQLLQEPVGATRQRALVLPELELDDEHDADGVAANLRLTRIPTGILVEGRLTATVTLECIRCLEEFDQPVETTFADEYRPTIDILTGHDIEQDGETDEADYFSISDTHVLDVGESLRQAILLALPMAPRCREDCPGITDAADAVPEDSDDRLAVLGQLLGTDSAASTDDEDDPGEPEDGPHRAAR